MLYTTKYERRLAEHVAKSRKALHLFIELGSGRGHTITFGPGYWKVRALLSVNDPFEQWIGRPLVLCYRMAMEARIDHGRFQRIARQSQPQDPSGAGDRDRPWGGSHPHPRRPGPEAGPTDGRDTFPMESEFRRREDLADQSGGPVL